MLSKIKMPAALVLVLVLFLTAACKKNNDNDPQPAGNADSTNNGNSGNDGAALADSGKVILHLHNYLEEEEVDGYGLTYTTGDGRKISLTRAQLYISDIQLVKSDGSLYDMTGVIVLKRQEELGYTLGKVPAGDYKGVRFHVGLDGDANRLAPEARADGMLNHPEMWLGTTAQPDGYVFLNLQGSIDTTADASGDAADMQPFVYRIGTDAHYREVQMPEKAFRVEKDGTVYVHTKCDYTRLFSGIQLGNSANLKVETAADNSSALAHKLADNIPSMFTYE